MVYFVMELLAGESLADRVKRLPLTLDETRHVIEQCCSALAASHAKGIVHRDLKPDNLFLGTRGNDPNFVKILDFGIAKLTGAGAASSKTQTGTVIGTPYYMSPEQYADPTTVDARSDVFSLGIVLFEILTGTWPYTYATRRELFSKVMKGDLERHPRRRRPEIPDWLDAIVARSLAFEREQRYQSADAMRTALLRADGETPPRPGFFRRLITRG
jgi:serine/threonine-protein kinase